jgi:hypothetical protein
MRNVSPEDEILQSKIEDEGSIILDFKALSASVESLACGKCGISKLVANKKTTGLATRFDITCQNCYHTVTTLPKKGYPHLVTCHQYKKTVSMISGLTSSP